MGYHIIPGALTALIAGRLFSRPTCYQMTGGPMEIAGGGYTADNFVLRSLGKPSPFLERLAFRVVREFDLVVVRGSQARCFLYAQGIKPIAVITGSVDPERFRGLSQRCYDMICVAQLIERKKPLEFVEVVAAIRHSIPSVRAAIVGDGPLMNEVRDHISRLGIADNVAVLGSKRDVETFLSRSKVFLLTSRDEGLPIALAEAMMAGVVPVVANVGDLGDLVRDGINGYLVHPDNRRGFVVRAEKVLRDVELWSRLSGAAVQSAGSHVSLERVTALWSTHLQEVVSRYQGNLAGGVR